MNTNTNSINRGRLIFYDRFWTRHAIFLNFFDSFFFFSVSNGYYYRFSSNGFFNFSFLGFY